MLIEQKSNRVRPPVAKPRSGVRVGFRLATVLLLRIPEVRAALKLRAEREGLADPESLADHLGLEPSYLRRVLRDLRDAGLTKVQEIPQRGAPPHHSYSIEVEATLAKSRAG